MQQGIKHRLSRFINHRYTDLTVALLILISIFVLLLELLTVFDAQWTRRLFILSEVFVWIFIVELSLRYYVAPRKSRFFRKYWIDIIAVIPFARSLRVFRVLRLLRIFRMGQLLSRSMSGFRQVFIEGRTETMIILVTIFVIVVIAGVGVHMHEGGGAFTKIGDALWWALLSLIAGEPIGGEPNTTFGRILMVLVMIGGMTVFAMFTGLFSAVMVKRLQSEMEVKSMEIEDLSEHIIICGWNRMARLLFQEFKNDPAMSEIPIVVIGEFGEMDVLKTAGDLKEFVYPLKGDPTRIDVLEMAGAERATFAVLLADKLTPRSDQDRDARTILTALTLEKMNPEIYTIAEMLSREGINHLKIAGVEEVIVGDAISSNLIATSIRNQGSLALVEELCTSRFGCQFYKIDVPSRFQGNPFEQIFLQIKKDHDATIVGVERSTNGSPEMLTNPSLTEILRKGDKLVLIAEKQPNLS